MSRACLSLLALVACAQPLLSQDLTKLPRWAQTAATTALKETAPGDVDAWVLLNRTELTYLGDGEVRHHTYRLVKVLTEAGINERAYGIHGYGGRASRIKSIKGWNLRLDNELVKLDPDTTFTLSEGDSTGTNTGTLTGVVLSRVAKGSILAFESVAITALPVGPHEGLEVLESNPVFRWELAVASDTPGKYKADLQARHVQPWLAQSTLEPGTAFTASHVPALPKDEGACPPWRNVLPEIWVRFQDDKLANLPSSLSWETLGSFYSTSYRSCQEVTGAVPLKGKEPLDGLRTLLTWMGQQIPYKAVYLSPERGWVPERGSATLRKRYGDCKDMTCFLAGELAALGLTAGPALTRITDHLIEADAPVSALAFNHVITAVKLEHSLGLAAELDTAQGRFLLVDPTDHNTPLGRLGGHFRGQRVLLCLPQGSLLVPIPDSALQLPRDHYTLTGSVDAQGVLTGTLRIQDQGGALGLRDYVRNQGTSKLREHLLSQILDLPATGKLTVTQVGDPDRLDQPFEVTVSLEHPTAFRGSGRERQLTDLGLFPRPGSIQRPATPRLLPVASPWTSESCRTLEADLSFATPVTPVLTSREHLSPFHKLAWSNQAEAKGTGTRVRIRVENQRRLASYPVPDQEQGVTAWKKDRTGFGNLREEGLSFAISAP